VVEILFEGSMLIAPLGGSIPPGVIKTGIGARKARGIDGGDQDHLLEKDIEIDQPDPLEEFLEGGEVGDLL
jgi:hypothetical protein